MNQRFPSISLPLVASLLLLVSGCQKRIKPNDLTKLKIGMTKEQVVKELGQPTLYRGSQINEHNQLVDVLEYTVNLGSTPEEWSRYMVILLSPFHYFAGLVFGTHLETYWLFFHDNILNKWCRAGDWGTSQQHDSKEVTTE